MRLRIFLPLLVACAAVNGPRADTGDADNILSGGPAVPPGYSSHDEVMKAVVSGKVKLVKAPETLPETVIAHKDIEYARVGDRSLTLDLYAPKHIEKPAPVLVFIHGGGWQQGNKNDYRVYTIDYASKGYVAATISYRLRQEALFPAAVHDVKAALRWIRANADAYGIDPEKIALIGGSAGGHLSLLAGYSDTPELEGETANPGTRTRVQAIINFYGPSDLTTEHARTAPEVTAFLGADFDTSPGLFALASPITHITKDDPPTLTFHGTLDELVPVAQADALHAKLTELGVPNVYDRIEGWPHTLDAALEINRHCQGVMDRFLAKHLPLPK